MSRVIAALIATTLVAAAIPTAASAGCYSCYVPPQPCGTCYQQQVVPPQYRTVEETVMVAPEGVAYEQIPPEYATQQHVQMVSPGYSYYAPVRPRCGACGY